MTFLQNHTQETFIGEPSYPSFDTVNDYDVEHFTQTPTPLQSQNQSPQLSGGHGDVGPATAAGLAIQPDVPAIDIDPQLTTTTVFPDLLGSPEEEEFVSVSTAFPPTASPVDTIFLSCDGVLFYAHSSTILAVCKSAFRELLGSPLDNPKFRDTLIPVASISTELNIILHMIYGMSPASYSPTFEILASAVDVMPTYSITPCDHILPGTPLYTLLLSYAPLRPLDVYGLAAHHNIHPLAVMTSSHLLSYPLQTITDSQADRIGAVYLKKLMMLHAHRFNALKNALLEPPHPHSPTRDCDFSTQKKLSRAWSLVSASLVWDARPDMSAHSIQAALDPLLIQFDCEGCQTSLRNRLKDLIVRWTAVTFYFGRLRHWGAPSEPAEIGMTW